MRCQSEGLPSLKRMRLLATWAVQRQRTFLREIGHRHLLRLRYQASEKRLVKSSSRVRKANWVTLERDRDGRQIDLVRESFLSSSLSRSKTATNTAITSSNQSSFSCSKFAQWSCFVRKHTLHRITWCGWISGQIKPQEYPGSRPGNRISHQISQPIAITCLVQLTALNVEIMESRWTELFMARH